MKIFITGILGFIGSHLAKFHLAQGDEVWGIDNLSTGQKENLLEGATVTEANLLDWADLPKALQWAEGVYHMAAMVGQQVVLKEPLEVLTSNIAGCERILTILIQKNRECRLLIASSSEVYGHNKESLFTEDEEIHFSSVDHVQGNYALSKFINEKMALAATLQHGLPCTIARLFNTTGVGQTGRYGMVVPRFVQQAMHNKPITIYGKGTQTRSFCDVRDTVAMLTQLLVHPSAEGEIINVGNDREISIYDLALLVKEVTQSSSTLSYHNYQDAYSFNFQETERRCPNLEKIRKLLHFHPSYTLEETLTTMRQKNTFTIKS